MKTELEAKNIAISYLVGRCLAGNNFGAEKFMREHELTSVPRLINHGPLGMTLIVGDHRIDVLPSIKKRD